MSKKKSKSLSLLGFLIMLVSLINASCGNGGADFPSFSQAEPDEELSGGETTVFATTSDAFGQPAANLSLQQNDDFKIGNSFFEQNWVTAPSTTTARDGLGPTFNARACASCHVKDGRGSLPENPEDKPVGLLFRLSIPGQDPVSQAPLPHPAYGGQLQPSSILGVPEEGSVLISYEEIPDQYEDGNAYSLLNPSYEFINLGFGPLGEFFFSPRLAPAMIGMGLLEAIDQEDILALSDPEDLDGDGISGKPNWVWDSESQSQTLGRFGWKAEQPSVRAQVAAAFLGDIGITSPAHLQNNCPNPQLDCQSSPNGGEPEIKTEIFDQVVFYSSTLAVPARRNWEDPQVLAGKSHFYEMGCVQCHQPNFVTRASSPIAALSGQVIRPYTDLLLHDMGEGLSDGRPSFEAKGSEWRTPPLWGLGLNNVVSGEEKVRYLHDGRARNLAEAILWHGGEAEGAKENFRQASLEEREELLKFLNSL